MFGVGNINQEGLITDIFNCKLIYNANTNMFSYM